MHNDQPVEIKRRKSRALFYYVAAHRKPVSREELLRIFWMDLPRRSAQQTLRTSLHGLRKDVGDILDVERKSVGLSSAVQIDIHLLEELEKQDSQANIEDLEKGAALYRGEFLQGVLLPDVQPFEDWLIIERERFRRLATRFLTSLSSAYQAEKRYEMAMDALERALSIAPLQEDLQRQSIWLHYLSGDRPGAIRRYHDFRQLLDKEMGVPPMAETRSLYDQIISDKQLPAPLITGISGPHPRKITKPSARILPFVGRHAEMQRVQDQFTAGKFVLIEGEPGIGKTRLAHEFLKNPHRIALTGSASELEMAVPYQPVIEALRSLTKRSDWPRLLASIRQDLLPVWLLEIQRLLPELTHEPDVRPASQIHIADGARLWEGVRQFLYVISRSHKLVFFIDDVHWADEASLGLLGYLARQSDSLDVNFLAAMRPHPLNPGLSSFIQMLTRTGRLHRLQLSRLSEDDLIKIAEWISPEYAFPLSAWLWRTSEGNPYLVAELLRYAREAQIITPDADVDLSALAEAPIVPQTVYSLIHSQLARLTESARRVIDTAVAVGRQFEFELIAQASGLSENAVLDALDELQTAGLIETVNATVFKFRHSLTMEVAFREVGELRHRLLHRRVAEAMERIYAGQKDRYASQIAFHFAESDDLQRAAHYSFTAGQSAMRLAAWKEAIGYFKQALTGVADQARLPILMALAEVQSKAGQYPQSSETYREALSLVLDRENDTGEEGASRVESIQLAFARTLLPQARFEEVTDLANAISTCDRSDSIIAAELIWGTALSLEGSDLDSAAEHLRVAERQWENDPGNDRTTIAQIKFELGGIAAQKGDLEKALALYHESLQISSQLQDDFALEQQILALNNIAYHSLLLGRPDARQYAARGLSLAQEHGILGLQPFLYSTLGEISMAMGEFDLALQHFNYGLELAREFSFSERVAGLTANLGRLAAIQDQDSLALHHLSSAFGLAESIGTRHLAAQICIWMAPLLPAEEARRHLNQARSFAEGSGRLRLLAEIADMEAQIRT